MLKRIFDIAFASLMLLVLSVPIALITAAIRVTSEGPAIYWSDRIGRSNKVFRMPKFRTMLIDAPTVATHLMDKPDRYVTPVGRVLRKTSLDELPQLWSILVGDMSLVGPRPALFNQHDLVQLRSEYGVDRLIPGLTGWAQVNGRDEIPVRDKVKLDVEYLKRQSFLFDCKIILLTFVRVTKRQGVAH